LLPPDDLQAGDLLFPLDLVNCFNRSNQTQSSLITMSQTTALDAEYWNQRYQEGSTRWDLGQPAPPFVNLLTDAVLPPGKIVVLGAGNGHDAMLFAEHGFEVVGVDFASEAIECATATAKSRGLKAEFLQRDIFGLLPEFNQSFDYVLEHTCFCAIEPKLRSQYVELVRSLLKPSGQLLALFFTHARPGGPPFATTPTEINELFADRFEILSLEPAMDSIEVRQGEEYLGILQKR
jgi:methyl halide transferase